MRLLYGTWTGSAFHIWGQDAADPAGVEHPDRDARALPAGELHALLGEVSDEGLLAATAAESSIELWWPHRGSAPLAPGGTSGVAEDVAWRRKTFPTLAFAPADALDLLLSMARYGGDAEAIGDALRYWMHLARYVVTLLAARQLIPDIRHWDDSRFEAHWRLIVTDRDHLAWLERVAAAMPPVCRAVPTDDPTESDPVHLLDSFLMITAEALIRRNLSGDAFFEQIRRRSEREGGWELAWLAALVGDDPTIAADPEVWVDLAARHRGWISALEARDDAAPPDLGFTLIEPPPDVPVRDAAWRARFDLRSAEDGSPLDIDQIWLEPSSDVVVLGRHLVNRRQHVQAELRRAAQVFPELNALPEDAAPTGINLTTNEAFAFIRERTPLLRAQGFRVDLPDWATATGDRLGLELTVAPRRAAAEEQTSAAGGGVSRLGLSTLVDFNWRVAVGHQPVSIETFQQLAEQQASLVRVGGQWVPFDQAAAEQALAFVQRQPHGEITLAEAIRLAGGASEIDAGLPVVGLTGADWIDAFLRQLDSVQLEAIEQPPGFRGDLRPYQLRGLQWLDFLDRLEIGACLADDMGLGKTIQLIALLLHERAEARLVGPTLLFAPMSVVGNWQREVMRFAPHLRVMVHRGPDRLTGQAFVNAAPEQDLIITTYGLAHRDLKALGKVRWYRLALDEAQKIKNPSANQTIAIRSLRADLRVALTGTPLENHLSELWSIMEMLNPGLLGSAAEFRRRFAVPIEKMGDRDRAEQLRQLIRPFILRRIKNDPQVECDLPEKMEMSVYCNLTGEQAAHYERTVAAMLEQIDAASGIRRRGLILTTLTRLKQVCNHPAQLTGDEQPLDGRSGKCERLIEMLEEVLDEGDAALVFTQFRAMGNLLAKLVQARLRVTPLFMHGGSTAKKRDSMIDTFQDPNGPHRVFIMSLKTGGFGLNLTRANHVFHFDRWWNPAVEQQATDRAHRIGQTRRVQVHKFVCLGTIEERIDQLLQEKAALADNIIGSGDDWLTGLSTTELRDYLALSRDAVAEADA